MAPSAPMKVKGSAAIAFVALVVVACDSGRKGPTATTFRDSSGVRIASAPPADHPLDWQIRRVASLGGNETGPEAFFNIGHAIGADARGRLYVLDRGNHRVLVFDSTGAFITAHGAKGGGPGEFQDPEALVVHPDGTIHVFDFGKRGFVRFAPDGTSVETVPAGHFFGGEDITFDGTRVVHVRVVRSGSAASDSLQLVSYEPGGEPAVLAARPIPPGRSVRFSGCPLTMGGMRPFLMPAINWSQHGDELLVHATDGYDLALYHRDSLRMLIRRPIAAIAVTSALAERAAGEEFGAEGFVITYPYGRCVIPPVEMVAQRGHSERVAPVRSIHLAPDQSVWVRRRNADTGDLVDVFTKAGEYLGTLPQGTPFPDAFFDDTRFAVVERDSVGLEHVVLYEIVRGGAADRQNSRGSGGA